MQGKEVNAFLRQHNVTDEQYKTSPKTTEVAGHPMPFYEMAVLVRLYDKAWPQNLKIYYLEMPGGHMYRLNGKSTPIQRVNAAAPLKLTPQNVLEYLRWYGFFVRSDEGPLLIVEDMHDLYMPQALDAEIHARMASLVRPTTYEGRNAEGYFLNAMVLYGNGLFRVHFKVRPDGMVAVLGEEQLATDLPVRVDAPIA
jgi:hypothetical protein